MKFFNIQYKSGADTTELLCAMLPEQDNIVFFQKKSQDADKTFKPTILRELYHFSYFIVTQFFATNDMDVSNENLADEHILIIPKSTVFALSTKKFITFTAYESSNIDSSMITKLRTLIEGPTVNRATYLKDRTNQEIASSDTDINLKKLEKTQQSSSTQSSSPVSTTTTPFTLNPNSPTIWQPPKANSGSSSGATVSPWEIYSNPSTGPLTELRSEKEAKPEETIEPEGDVSPLQPRHIDQFL